MLSAVVRSAQVEGRGRAALPAPGGPRGGGRPIAILATGPCCFRCAATRPRAADSACSSLMLIVNKVGACAGHTMDPSLWQTPPDTTLWQRAAAGAIPAPASCCCPVGCRASNPSPYHIIPPPSMRTGCHLQPAMPDVRASLPAGLLSGRVRRRRPLQGHPGGQDGVGEAQTVRLGGHRLPRHHLRKHQGACHGGVPLLLLACASACMQAKRACACVRG